MSKKNTAFQTHAPRLSAITLGLAVGGLIQSGQDVRSLTLPSSSPRIAIGSTSAFQNLTSLHTAEASDTPGFLSVRRGTLARNETLSELVERLGGSSHETARAVSSLTSHIDMRRLPRGLSVSVALTKDQQKLAGVSVYPEIGRQILAMPVHSGVWSAYELKAQLTTHHAQIKGPVKTSIYGLIKDQGGSDQKVIDFANIFAYDVDFQRQVRPGDQLEILYETLTDERGQLVRTGNILYASIQGRNVSRIYYRFAPDNTSQLVYYDENGISPRKFLMKVPINGARLSSPFGIRKHPILGYTKMHKGADFAARTGTPVMAAGDGLVEFAGQKGGYGKYIRLRHSNGYATAYAHLHKIDPRSKRGYRVKQGYVIGYVGSTGRSTGPHLHYEVIHKGKHIDPLKLKLPTNGEPLTGQKLQAFMQEKARIDALRNQPAEPEASTSIMLLDTLASQ